LIQKKRFLGRQLAARKFDLFSCPQPPKAISKSCEVSSFQINGRNIFRLKPKHKEPAKHILYLHGGAYVQRFVRFHWKFLAELVNKANCYITAPDYPLAPEFTYKESFEMVLPLYQQILTTTASENVIIMGDSSGGGFALALAQKIRDEKIDQPRLIFLLSPWLDITLANPEISELEAADPFLEKQSLQRAGKLYAGDTTTDHYLLSPINGSLEGLGKIVVLAGAKEILVADTRRLDLLAKSQGIPLHYYEYPDMVHAWMFLNFPEAKKARQQIIDLIVES
jgi:acetyl esterase/lipase